MRPLVAVALLTLLLLDPFFEILTPEAKGGAFKALSLNHTRTWLVESIFEQLLLFLPHTVQVVVSANIYLGSI